MSTTNPNRQPTILCIDDDPAVTTAIRLRLSRYDVNVRSACDGHEGMWAAVNECPDVIITDIRMPNGNGDYVIECLKGRAQTSNIPVLVLTGRRDQELKRWMLTLGVEHYIHKPVDFDRLVNKLRRYIDLRSTYVAGHSCPTIWATCCANFPGASIAPQTGYRNSSEFG